MPQRRRLGRVQIVLLAAVLGIIAAFALMIYRYANSQVAAAADYEGTGTGSAMLHVQPGDSLSEVGDTLYDIGTIASTRAFVGAATGTVVEGIQPGYYQVRQEMSASAAVDLLADPDSRVGLIDVPNGARLLDTFVIGGTPELGIFHRIANASCTRNMEALSDPPTCYTPQEIVEAAEFTPPEELGVPEWAVSEVENAPDGVRRLEGLVFPGVHNFDPTGSPQDILRSIITDSAAQYEESGLVASAEEVGLTPYQLLVAASLVEKEGLHAEDFGKIARVILNRLEAPQRLEFDSTVNYSLDDQEVATTDADRAADTPWNTYAMDGLPYGPIATPGREALHAMEHPAEGPWLYFVTIDQEGTTVFTEDFQEHLANVEESARSGILTSGR